MAKELILVVDDEEDIVELVRYNLNREGYRVKTAGTGEAALEATTGERPDLIVLDLMLPGIDGLQVCRILKHDPNAAHIPIVMLTAKGAESDVIVGLEMGADDYVTKPFSPRILAARVKAVLRRTKEAALMTRSGRIQVEGLVIDPDRHETTVDGCPLDLTSTEFRILHYLAQHRGRVFTRDQIVDAARGADYPVTDRSVDVHVVSLRKKLGAYRKLIETVHGVGYRFKD